MGAAFGAGAVTHVLLFVGYALYKAEVIGNTGLLIYAGVIGFTPPLVIPTRLGDRPAVEC